MYEQLYINLGNVYISYEIKNKTKKTGQVAPLKKKIKRTKIK